MKFRLTVLIASILLLITSIFIPDLMVSAVPKVGVTRLQKTVYNQYLNSSGSIEVEKKSDISVDIPVMISRIEVEVGDYVKKGQRVAVVDKDATVSAYSGINSIAAVSALLGGSVSAVPEELLSQFVSAGGTSISEYIEKNRQAIETLPNVLSAPASGVVTAVNVQEGEMSAPLAPIMTIAQSDTLAARVSVSETNISKVKEGQKATLTILAKSGLQYDCVVSKIYPTAQKSLLSTSNEAMVDVLLKIVHPDSNLKPGYTAKCKITIETGREASILPYEVICQDDDQNEFVYVYSDGRIYKRIIETESELLNGVEIKSGVTESDYVISNPSDALKDNMLVCLTGG